MGLTNPIKHHDLRSIRQAIQQLSHLRLGGGASVTFAELTLSGLTASRLLASNATKGLVSTDLNSWIAGTTNQITVTDDGDGSVTLSTPQDIDTGATNFTVAGATIDSKVVQSLLDAFNGTFIETIEFLVTESAGTVTGSLQQTGGGDLTQCFSDGFSTLDCTDPVCTVDLTAYVGTDTVPKEVFVYILQSAKTTITASNTAWPSTEHIKIANLVLRSAATTGTDGALVNRNWNDHAIGTDNQGHITHIEERIRQLGVCWDNGVALTLKDAAGAALTTTNSSTAVELVTSAGEVYQLHKQTFPATDMYVTATDDAHIANQVVDEGGAYATTTDLVTDITQYVDGTDAGGTIGVNKYFNLVIWGVQNKTGENSHLMINLPTNVYTLEANATADIDGYSVYDIPDAFAGTGFLIARLTFRLIAGSQWTYIAQEDLRGLAPATSAGVGISTTDHALLANLAYADAGHTGFEQSGAAAAAVATHESTFNHADVLVDGDFASAGLMFTDGAGTYSIKAIGTDVQAYHANLAAIAAGTWTGANSITTLGTIATGTWEATDVGIAHGGTGQSTAQAAIDALTAVAGATDEYVLTKDTATGNAKWKVATGGSDAFTVKVDAAATAGYLGVAFNDGVLRADGSNITYTDGGDFVTLTTAQGIQTSSTPTFAGLILADGGTVGQAAGPLITFDNTNNYLEISGCYVGIGTTTPQRLLDLRSDEVTTVTVLGMYNADTTEGNGAVFSFRGDTTGAGASSYVEFGAVECKYYHGHSLHESTLSFFNCIDGVLRNTMKIDYSGGIFMPYLKSGTDQANAGAAANELYHDTDDNTIKLGV